MYLVVSTMKHNIKGFVSHSNILPRGGAASPQPPEPVQWGVKTIRPGVRSLIAWGAFQMMLYVGCVCAQDLRQQRVHQPTTAESSKAQRSEWAPGKPYNYEDAL